VTIIEFVDGNIKTEKLSAADILRLVLTPIKAAAGNKFGQWQGRGE